jgi:photosystem II stability/assembly factor-like uncharacterized protein
MKTRRTKIKPSVWITILACTLSIDSKAQLFKYTNDTSLKNFYEIKVAFETDWIKEHGSLSSSFKLPEGINNAPAYNEQENELIHFKRWEAFVAPRVYPSGNIGLTSSTYDNFRAYQANRNASHVNARLEATPTWSFVGPPGSSVGGGNAGRMNFIRFDPTNSNIIYAGSPSGGLWKTSDGGTTWKPISDYMPLIGCSDLGIDPTNSNILYLATGDNDGGDTKSIGIMKSTDGGTTWLTTGLSWTPGQNRHISRVLVNPTTPQTILCFGSEGVYRSTNGGTTWTQTFNGAGYIKDAELKPGDATIVYAVSNRLYRSTNGGASFTVVAGGTPTSDIGRMSVDVSPASPNYVYLFYSLSNGDFKGVYRSTDSGLNFTLQSASNTSNILGYDATYGGSNQTWYDMAFAVSKVDANVMIASGVRNWISKDGGVTWTVATKDCINANLEMHWDIHYLEFLPGSSTTAYAANDGGVYKTVNSGSCWTAINKNNISVNQIYGFGVATDNPEIMISGHQDGATIVHTNGVYNSALGGDGFMAFIDRTNSKVMYGELYFGGFSRSTDGGVNWTWLADNPGLVNLDGGWVTPWCQDPIEPNSLWGGYDQIFKSTDRGNNWTKMGTIPGSGSMKTLCVAPSNNQVVYAARPTELYVTKNNGGTWTSIIAGLPNLAIGGIVVSEKDPQHAWVTFSGYTANQKVYETTNGGSSWTSVSAGLPNLPVNCIQYVPGSTTNEIYVGCDVGVYYKNSSLNSWIPYFDGLAYAPVFDIEIYTKGKEIRVATYGRGIWKSPLYVPSVTDIEASTVPASAIGNNGVDLFKIYPNPVSDVIMVVAPGNISSVKLFNAIGQQLETPLFDNSGLVQLSHYSKGIYTIEVTITDGRKWVKKILKE